MNVTKTDQNATKVLSASIRHDLVPNRIFVDDNGAVVFQFASADGARTCELICNDTGIMALKNNTMMNYLESKTVKDLDDVLTELQNFIAGVI